MCAVRPARGRNRYRARVAFDAAADTVQEKVKGGEPGVGFEHFPDPRG